MEWGAFCEAAIIFEPFTFSVVAEIDVIEKLHIGLPVQCDPDDVFRTEVGIFGVEEFHTQRFRFQGDWFVGLSDTPSSEALARTASSVRPSFSPITRVGVFSPASLRSANASVADQLFPVFLVYFGIVLTFVCSLLSGLKKPLYSAVDKCYPTFVTCQLRNRQ